MPACVFVVCATSYIVVCVMSYIVVCVMSIVVCGVCVCPIFGLAPHASTSTPRIGASFLVISC